MASLSSLEVELGYNKTGYALKTWSIWSKLTVSRHRLGEGLGPVRHGAGEGMMYLLCLEPVLQLEPQLVWLVLDDAGGPEAGPGLHAQRCVSRALPHGVEAWVLHGRVAALRHLSLRRRVLLGEHRGLLLHQDARLLAGEGLWVDSLALQKYVNKRNSWRDMAFHGMIRD